MMKILKLNAISPVADETFKGYEYSENVQNFMIDRYFFTTLFV